MVEVIDNSTNISDFLSRVFALPPHTSISFRMPTSRTSPNQTFTFRRDNK